MKVIEVMVVMVDGELIKVIQVIGKVWMWCAWNYGNE